MNAMLREDTSVLHFVRDTSGVSLWTGALTIPEGSGECAVAKTQALKAVGSCPQHVVAMGDGNCGFFNVYATPQTMCDNLVPCGFAMCIRSLTSTPCLLLIRLQRDLPQVAEDVRFPEHVCQNVATNDKRLTTLVRLFLQFKLDACRASVPRRVRSVSPHAVCVVCWATALLKNLAACRVGHHGGYFRTSS